MTAEILRLPRRFRVVAQTRDGNLFSTELPTLEAAEHFAATIERLDMSAGASCVPGAQFEAPSDSPLPDRVLP